jgi:acyl-[acyl carrier protein]--UDP-N-acetylglucosamine O-acyltransferase
MIGAGSVVTRDVPDHGLVFGNPARLHGFVCACGHRLDLPEESPPLPKGLQPSAERPPNLRTPQTSKHGEEKTVTLICSKCKVTIEVSTVDWERAQ